MNLSAKKNKEIFIQSKKWDTEFDNSRAWRARIGFILIQNETIIEGDMTRLTPEGVETHFVSSAEDWVDGCSEKGSPCGAQGAKTVPRSDHFPAKMKVVIRTRKEEEFCFENASDNGPELVQQVSKFVQKVTKMVQ